MGRYRINLPKVEACLYGSQTGFQSTKQAFSAPRDRISDEVFANMIAGYRYLDEILARGIDLFKLGNSKYLLELNRHVLCGSDQAQMKNYERHLSATEERFYEKAGGGIGSVMEWLQRHSGEQVWNRAAGVYIQIISRPELYIEGNHRTGALVMSYMLVTEGKPPFVLSVDNADTYFALSGIAKRTNKQSLAMMIRFPMLKKRLARLLMENGNSDFVVSSSVP